MSFLRRSWSTYGAVLFGGFVLLVAVAGPLLAPYTPTESVGVPFTPPSGEALLGTDILGRDVLSRVLHGGTQLLVLAAAATICAYALGAGIGLMAGYVGGSVDTILMRMIDGIMAFPAFLLLLVLATGLGPGPVMVFIGTTIVLISPISRIVRSATLEVGGRGYVNAAVARGESIRSVISREILPNISPTIGADIGPRFTLALLAIASLNFFGIGIAAPAADWGLMINENRPGIVSQPMAVLAPALLIATLTISVNVIADSLARRLGRSVEEALVR